MSGRRVIPFRADDGLDYRAENMFKRMFNQPVEKPPLKFGDHFEENERFWADVIESMKDVEASLAERETRKEQLEWLRQGRADLTATKQYLRDRKAPPSARQASRPERSSRG